MIDGLSWYLTGAAAEDDAQRSVADSLGGYRSSVPVEPLMLYRRNPIAGIRVVLAAGANGPGVGRLVAETPDTLRWRSPGGEFGDAVTIPETDDLVRIEGDDADTWVIVERMGALTRPLAGEEQVRLLDMFNNAVGGVDFLSSGSAQQRYRAIMAVNRSGASLTDLAFNVLEGPVRIATETPSNGALQTIADDETEPSGVTWEEATASVGTLGDGDAVGLWIEVTCEMNAEGAPEERVRLGWSSNEEGGELRGAHRIEETGLARFEFYIGDGEDPVGTGSPDEVLAPEIEDGRVKYEDGKPALPTDSTLDLTPPGDYRVAMTYRNPWGLTSALSAVQRFVLNEQGELVTPPPKAPQEVSVRPGPGGTALVDALYVPAREASADSVADEWAVWITDDESEPDSETEPDHVEAMPANPNRALVALTWQSDGYADGTLLKVGVGVRRDGVASELVVKEVTAEDAGGELGRLRVSFGDRRGLYVE